MRGRQRRVRLARLLILCVAGLLYMFTLSHDLMVMNDDESGYIILARSLNEGRGYRNIYLPGDPYETKVPFLFPAVLALMLRVSPDIFLLKLLPLLLTVFSAGMLYRFLRREHASSSIALFCTALFAFNPLVVFSSTRLVTEPLYVFLSLACLLLLQEAQTRKKYVLALCPVLLLLFFTRHAAITLAAAAMIYFHRKGYRTRSLILAGCVLTVGAAWLWLDHILNAAGARFSDVVQGNFLGAGEPGFNFLGGLIHFARYALSYASVHFVDALSYPLALNITRGQSALLLLKVAAGLTLTGMAVFGFIRQVSRELRPHHLYTVLYLVFFSMFSFRGERYLLPVLPFLLFYLLYGINEISKKVRSRPLFADLAVVLAFGLFFVACEADAFLLFKQKVSPHSPAEYSYMACADWVRRNTDPGSVVLCRKPRVFYLLSGRKARWFFPKQGAELPEADYLVTDKIWETKDVRVYNALPLYCAGIQYSCVYDLKDRSGR